jgi:hypothetical protein
MRFLSSLDAKDRSILLWSVGIAIVLAVVIGFVLPGGNSNDNPMPSSYLSGRHGARAAYETLLRSGYAVERWEQPIKDLAAAAGPETVVIFADPFTRENEDVKAVRQIVERGGRVLSTGYWGGFILPGGQTAPATQFNFAACQLEPEGLDPLAGSGTIWMVPKATWQVGNPDQRIQYSCAGQPAVVEYDFHKGHVVWWASSTPLENGSLARDQNLELLLNSLGPREAHHFYWDESLHGDVRSEWSYVPGPALPLLWGGLAVLLFVIIASFSRRRGPVYELPPAPRATPMEFLEALGSLYRNAGAASTAVAIAWERFRRDALRICGLRQEALEAVDLAVTIRRRFTKADPHLESDLAACEEASKDEDLESRKALRFIHTLHHHREVLSRLAKTGDENIG